jgi:hypothetical protein
VVASSGIVPPMGRVTVRRVGRRPWTRRAAFLCAALLTGVVVVGVRSGLDGLLGVWLQLAAAAAGLSTVALRRLEPARTVEVREVELPVESSGPVIH